MWPVAPLTYRESPVEVQMYLPQVVSREEWLSARRRLLAKEQELTRHRDALNSDRRKLPMVRVEKDYLFDGARGQVGLAALFDGCRQLIIHHFMFDPNWEAGCPSCSAASDELSAGLLARLRARDTAFAAVSLAPFAKIKAYQAWNGWTFPWYSSFGSDFNYDFHVTLDEKVAPVVYDFQSKAEILAGDEDNDLVVADEPVEVPGVSCFLRDGDSIFHTYSTYADGVEQLSCAQSFLDLTALGNEAARAGRPRLRSV
jgi:predicted dithiol-disulfide oxidoreductase (DUF899 family)